MWKFMFESTAIAQCIFQVCGIHLKNKVDFGGNREKAIAINFRA